MLVKILSDLHIHPMQNNFRYIDHGERVCILAGDIAEGMRGVNWAEANIPYHIDVLYVPGNHEYYGHDVLELKKDFEVYNKIGTHVTILDNAKIDINGIIFAGTTLWTDFQLYNNPDSAFVWARMLNDHHWIKYGGRKLQAYDVVDLHNKCFDFISKIEADVLITHYGHYQSESIKWKGHPATPGFLTRIPDNIHGKFKYHVHGHTHSCFDYIATSGARVLCNPKGYSFENIHFNEELVLNI